MSACTIPRCNRPASHRLRFTCTRGHTEQVDQCDAHTTEAREYAGDWACSHGTVPRRCWALAKLVEVAS